jgi:hypothetical protein
MVTSTSGLQPANTISDFSLSGATPAQSTDSFAQQLLTAIEGYIGKSGNNSQLEINIQSAGQNSGGSSQFVVTVQDLPASAASSAASATASLAGSPSPAASPATPSTPAATPASTSIFTSTAASAAMASGLTAPAAEASEAAAATTLSSAAGTNLTAADSSTGSGTTGGTTLTAAQLAQMTPTEAYWAEQPPAVQALQNMPPDQRFTAAQNLAAQGYAIDVPIMVWGWDPLATMLTREADGYSWVPSAMQTNVGSAPGIDYASSPDYDPTTAPPGSILVSTAFANGTNGQDAAAAGFGFDYGTQATS